MNKALSTAPSMGKELIELVSTALYTNPLTVYREYIQNAADSIEAARDRGLLKPGEGRICISIDPHKRTISIHDNGTGMSRKIFAKQMLSLGHSPKRHSSERGRWGIGRLAALGYCRRLSFKTSSPKDKKVTEVTWDCVAIKRYLDDPDYDANLENMIADVTSSRREDDSKDGEHFFEVTLSDIVRHGDDVLLNPDAVREYIAQVGPVPFSPEFSFGKDIETKLENHIDLKMHSIYMLGNDTPIYRPHCNEFSVQSSKTDTADSLEHFIFGGRNGGIAATGWILHHSYLGALRRSSSISGLRVRAGNMQIGDSRILEDIFSEPRFNSWTIGELHIIDPAVTPTGRRDALENNIHFRNILNQLHPIAREISSMCHQKSAIRNRIRSFKSTCEKIQLDFDILHQGVLSEGEVVQRKQKIENAIKTLEQVADTLNHTEIDINAYRKQISNFKKSLASLKTPTQKYKNNKRTQKFFDLIYKYIQDPKEAFDLAEKIKMDLNNTKIG